MTTSVTPRASFILADNPGIMTLDGTNTWILREPGATRSVVVDPGPDIAEHVDAVVAAAGEVALVLFTHHHWDHTDALESIVRATGAPTRALSPDYTRSADPLRDGETLEVDGLTIEVVTAPGHTKDSVAFLLPQDRALLSGDMVLGRGTTVVAHPDGALGPYLDSMRRFRALVTNGQVETILPGHGPVIDDPGAVLDFYLTHREERLDQVRSALAAGAVSARDVVETVYADVDPILWDAAELSVRAQLEYLQA
ncbi:MBL fold metallo-hydrolase [Aeromicrobium duanguangcaii]|uniref:MBL fold metallo-hydrolase n=1 Tax=Aeromicrobium duanguangcaii TaxID=2968086 RepID=A0ABY5KDT6_9ACTN|nr:MBL fold metallo-hydrolase [Aeromicrobium duanguangcaii]MCD9154303.1 MBL fold metallo-hydrolase [Aeromicrobium duanguangcaii]MCL3838049.1 MBL fold metallo-hydrolase [Aeromicrobium duanguangcaii]UUI68629.1 MBL fold metallo-hydrolase [Aeromicrobium duanguangcaii]